MNSVLITGASGLVGGSLAKALRLRNLLVLTTSRTLCSDAALCNYKTDLSNIKQVGALFTDKNISAIVHSAGRIKANDLQTYRRDNLDATKNVLTSARAVGTKKFIYFSTIEVYENNGPYTEESPTRPLSYYAQTKLEAEDYVRAASTREFQTIVIRLAGVHGPERKSGVIYNFIKAAKQNKPIMVLDPQSIYRFSFTADIALGIELILSKKDFLKPTYNLAGDEAASLLDFAMAIKKVTNSRSEIIYPDGIARRNRDLRIDKIRLDLGYSPLPTNYHLRSIASTV